MYKILLVNDYYTGGGAEAVFRNTYEILKKNNQNVDLFYGSKETIKPTNIFSYLYNKKAKKKLTNKLESFKPRIIHIHNYYHFLSPSIFIAIKKYKKKNNVKVVFTAHDYHLICASSGMMSFKNNKVYPIKQEDNCFFKLLFKSIDHRGLKYSLIKKIYWFWALKIVNVLKGVDVIISPSIFLKQMFQKCNIKKEIQLIRNPLLEIPNLNLNNIKIDCNNEIKCLFLGRLSQEKGLYEFITAFGALDFSQTKISLEVLGEGNEEDRLKELVKKLGIKNVCFHGYQKGKNLESFLINSNVLVLPSLWYENAPLSIIEGACYGNIILAKKIGGMEELSKMTKEYVLVDSWKDEIKSAFDKISQKGINNINDIDQFSEKKYLDNLINFYNLL